jgi:hypothetical protein
MKFDLLFCAFVVILLGTTLNSGLNISVELRSACFGAGLYALARGIWQLVFAPPSPTKISGPVA